jgi:hypothetical protein
MAEPPRRGLRPARRSGLTSPDRSASRNGRHGHPNPRPRGQEPGQAAEQASGRKPTPRLAWENSSCRNRTGSGLPELAGGSRLSPDAPEILGVVGCVKRERFPLSWDDGSISRLRRLVREGTCQVRLLHRGLFRRGCQVCGRPGPAGGRAGRHRGGRPGLPGTGRPMPTTSWNNRCDLLTGSSTVKATHPRGNLRRDNGPLSRSPVVAIRTAQLSRTWPGVRLWTGGGRRAHPESVSEVS